MKNGHADAFPFPGSEAQHQLPLGQHSGAPDAGAGAGDEYHACDKLGGQYVKFSEISYNRPDVEAAKKFYTEAAERLSTAGSFGEAEAVFLAVEDFSRQLDTMFTVAQIRHDIDTRDEFYNAEAGFIDSAAPELQEFTQRWDLAMLASPYRPEFERKYNRLMFLNTEIDLRTFSSEIVPELQRENALTTEYSKLLASAQIPFEGGTYTL